MAVDRHQIANGIVNARATWSALRDDVAIGDDTWPGAAADDVMINDGTGLTGTLVVAASPNNTLAELRMFETGGSPFEFAGLLDIDSVFNVVDANLAGSITGDSGLNIFGNIVSEIVEAGWSGYTGSVAALNSSAKTISTPGEQHTIANLIVNNAAPLTVVGTTLFIVGSFTLAGGTLNMDGKDLSVAGDIVRSSGAFTNSAIVSQTASGVVSWSTSSNRITHLRLAWGSGVTSTLTGLVYVKKFSFGEGVVDLSNQLLWIFDPAADNFWVDGAGSVATGTGRVSFNVIQGSRQNGAITCDCNLEMRGLVSTTLTMTGNINIGNREFFLRGSGASDKMVLIMAASNLTCGPLVHGTKAANGASADVDLGSGTHNIASWAVGNDANIGNVVNFNTCNLTLTGIFHGNADGANPITATNTSATVHGGEIRQLVVTGTLLDATDGVIDGGGNDGIDFIGAVTSIKRSSTSTGTNTGLAI